MSNNPSLPSSPKEGKMYFLLLSIVIFISYPTPSFTSNLFRFQQIAMGTVVEIVLAGNEEESAQRAALQAFQEIKRIERLMSPWIESSDVSHINRSAGKEWIRVAPETLRVIKKAQAVSELSGGGFDITAGPLVQLWRKAREKGVPPELDEVKRTLKRVNFKHVMFYPKERVFLQKRGMAIDLGGIAKGYAVDRAFELLEKKGFKNLIVNAGGDLRAGGLKLNQPWSIGVQHPRESQKILARISLSDGAMATSGDYEKYFIHQGKRYHHIVNPKDGFPAEGCQSVTLLHEDAMTADALATAVFVLGPEKGYALCQKIEGADCLIVDMEGKVAVSPGLRERISFIP